MRHDKMMRFLNQGRLQKVGMLMAGQLIAECCTVAGTIGLWIQHVLYYKELL